MPWFSPRRILFLAIVLTVVGAAVWWHFRPPPGVPLGVMLHREGDATVASDATVAMIGLATAIVGLATSVVTFAISLVKSRDRA